MFVSEVFVGHLSDDGDEERSGYVSILFEELNNFHKAVHAAGLES